MIFHPESFLTCRQDVSSKFQEPTIETTSVAITSCSHNICIIIPTTPKVIKKTQDQTVHTTYCLLTTTQNETVSTTTTTTYNGADIIQSSLITNGVISDDSHDNVGRILSDDLFTVTSAAAMPSEIQKVSSSGHESFLVHDGLTPNILSFQATSAEDLTRPHLILFTLFLQQISIQVLGQFINLGTYHAFSL
ncbi:unnamed protein product [Debaryomyces tyrocola]|nr:unnamed protein product [Debaryomyces tyrocola]